MSHRYFALVQLENNKSPGWQERNEKCQEDFNDAVYELQTAEWNVQKYIPFALNNGEQVMEAQKQLFEAIEVLLSTKQADLEEIRRKQHRFNATVRDAHGEMLSQAYPARIGAT